MKKLTAVAAGLTLLTLSLGIEPALARHGHGGFASGGAHFGHFGGHAGFARVGPARTSRSGTITTSAMGASWWSAIPMPTAAAVTG